MPGAQCTRSRACSVDSTRVSHRRPPESPGIPACNGVNGLFRALPGDRAFLSPSSAETCFRQLGAGVEASGPHGFSVRKSALSSAALLASIASRSNVRDDRETPLSVGRDGGDIKVIWGERKPEYFFKRDWTTQITLIRLRKLDFARKSTEPRGRLRSCSNGRRVGQAQELTITTAKLLKVY